MGNDPGETCWTLVRAAAAGDGEARAAFSRTYAVAIRGFFEMRWRMRALESDVDDATQEVFLECLRSDGVLSRADPARGDLRGLLFGVAKNVARRFEERAREGGRIRDKESDWFRELDSDEAGQATLFDRSWARALVRRAERDHRELAAAEGDTGRRRIELLERRFQGGEAIREIAADWGVPAQDVHNLFRTARAEFRTCLRRVVAAHVSAAEDVDGECERLLALLA